MSQAVEAYRGVTATDRFKYLEILRERTAHDEAQALYSAEKRGALAERNLWKGIVADKDAALADKDAALADKDAALANKDTLIAELMAKLGM